MTENSSRSAGQTADELQNAAAELHASEDLFHQLVDAITEYAILRLDASGHVVTWNPGVETIKGYGREEIIGEHFSVFYTPEDRAAGKPAKILETVRREGRLEDEGWRVRKDGTRLWANVVISALRDQGGEITGFAKVTRDLTEKRAAEDELHASEQRFHHLINAVTDYAIFMLDPTGHVVTWNPGVEKIKGYRRQEIVGQHFSVFYTLEDRAAGKPEKILETLRRDGRFEEDGWRVRKDGSRFWANVVISALRDQDGQITGFAKVTRDLTEKRAAELNEQELLREQIARAASERSAQEWERVNRAKDEFLATMSHELRTPLNAISGWATILRRKPREEAKLDHGLEAIERNVKAQTRLINDILEVSSIITGKLRLSFMCTDMFPLVAAAADVVKPAAEAKGVRLGADVDPAIGATMADPERLQQIMWNLLTNAVRFTPQGGRVTLTADRTGSGMVIRVKDTGAGISREHLPHVFERFMQIDGSTTRAHGGLGLGLSIVRHLVEAHGGTVEADSEGLGKGATFTISLPIRGFVDEARPAPAEGAPEEAVAAGNGADPQGAALVDVRVLVVEDDPDSLEVLSTFLQRAGALVTPAANAREAFEAFDSRGGFDLIISDIGMPETDGYALMRRIRTRDSGADVPAIALTAYARAEDIALAMRSGYQDHLAKPVDEDRLLAAARKWSRRPPTESTGGDANTSPDS